MLCAPSLYGPARADHCFKQLIFLGSWVLWPLLVLVLWWAWRQRRVWRSGAWLAWAFALGCVLIPIHMRFVERTLIVERHSTLKLGFEARIALISDLHVGLFKDEAFVARLVEKLNALEVDAVLVAGDWTYEPTRALPELLAPFKTLRHPILSVPGNHDEEIPGPPIAKALREALVSVGIKPIEYTHHRFARFTVVGLGDHWAKKDGLEPLRAAPKDLPIILLMHQPDTAMSIPRGAAALALAGHTHGGQVRFPFIGAVAKVTTHPFDRGLHSFTPLPTFVTSGLGEVGLPIRLLIPPVIDVLTIR